MKFTIYQTKLLSNIILFFVLPVISTGIYAFVQSQQQESISINNPPIHADSSHTDISDLVETKANYFHQLGIHYYTIQQYTDSIENYQQATIYYKQLHNKQLLAENYQHLAIAYRAYGNYQESLRYLKEAKNLMQTLCNYHKSHSYLASDTMHQYYKYQLTMADIYYDLGTTYYNVGNCKDAFKYHNKSYQIRLHSPKVHYTDLLMSQSAIKELKLYRGIIK